MSEATELRPLRRDDLAQLVELVNAHAGAVLPGVPLSANAVLSQLERDRTCATCTSGRADPPPRRRVGDRLQRDRRRAGRRVRRGRCRPHRRGALSRLAGWAELGNLRVAPKARRRGIGTWLLGTAAEWLRLGGARPQLAYGVEGGDDEGEMASSSPVAFASSPARGAHTSERANGATGSPGR